MGNRDSFLLAPVSHATPPEEKLSRLCKDPRCVHLPAHYTTRRCGGEIHEGDLVGNTYLYLKCNNFVCENAASQCACPSRKLCHECFERKAKFDVSKENDGIRLLRGPMAFALWTDYRCFCPKCKWRDYLAYQEVAQVIAQRNEATFREAEGLPLAYADSK